MRGALSVLVALALVGAASSPAFAAKGKNWGANVGTWASSPMLDNKGLCRDKSGKLVDPKLCKPAANKCLDPKTGGAIKCTLAKQP